MSLYIQRYDAEWVDVTDGQLLQCCDCGLVHECEFRIIKGDNGDFRVLKRVFRQNRDTAARRRSLMARKEGIFADYHFRRKKK